MRSSSIILLFTLILLPLASSQCFNGSLDEFLQGALDAHNSLRAKHQSPPMTLDSDINSRAQNYAQHLADTNSFKHSHAEGFGENLYMSSGMEVTGATAVQAWYDEINDYPSYYGESAVDNATGVVGHFTQVVWKDSTNLGCGVGCSADNAAYVVCNYTPQGNFRMNGAGYEENVLPPQ